MINFNLDQVLRASLLFGMMLSLAACGSAPARLPLAQEKSQKAEQAAHRAMREGDLIRARELFKQHMLLQESLDNREGSTIAAINLSSVSHLLGDDATALSLLNVILADATASITDDLRATAAFRKAVILTDSQNMAEANAAVELASQVCNRQCSSAQGINTLRARLAFNNGEFSVALLFAKEVIHSASEKNELANALRIAAAAESELGQYEAALQHYEAALEVDKELALNVRISEDFKGIISLLKKQGRTTEAEAYTRRAERVSEAAKQLSANK